jgi:hypothetical protein
LIFSLMNINETVKNFRWHIQLVNTKTLKGLVSSKFKFNSDFTDQILFDLFESRLINHNIFFSFIC